MTIHVYRQEVNALHQRLETLLTVNIMRSEYISLGPQELFSNKNLFECPPPLFCFLCTFGFGL